MKKVFAALVALGFACSTQASSSSYYTSKPPEPSAVVLNEQSFPGLHSDGLGDNTQLIQSAIDSVSRTTGKGVILVPQGVTGSARRFKFPQEFG
jgi:hypothetical protein